MLMASDTVLEVDNVSKLYARRPNATRARVRATLARVLKGQAHEPVSTLSKHEFWGVRNVSFRLKYGEAIGVIGLNGSGKSTLLRMLAGQILPDSGEIRVVGRSAAMIDLTAGFQTAESGRANIFLRGAALGRSRADMAAAQKEIIEFAELGDAIDAPVATYSSGMTMRLAFSIMVAAVPDLFLIDEVLGVGDFRFRQKCLAKVREIRQQSAFVLVSHNMSDIARFCDHVLVLHKGNVLFEGEPNAAIKFYQNLQMPKDTVGKATGTVGKGPVFTNEDIIKDVSHYWSDEKGDPVTEVVAGQPLELRLSFTSTRTIPALTVGVPVWTEDGTYVTGFSTDLGQAVFAVEAGERVGMRLVVSEIAFNPGRYISNLAMLDGPEFLYRRPNPMLAVKPRTNHWWGAVTLPHAWQRCAPVPPAASDQSLGKKLVATK